MGTVPHIHRRIDPTSKCEVWHAAEHSFSEPPKKIHSRFCNRTHLLLHHKLLGIQRVNLYKNIVGAEHIKQVASLASAPYHRPAPLFNEGGG
jgi:hypothetical protein